MDTPTLFAPDGGALSLNPAIRLVDAPVVMQNFVHLTHTDVDGTVLNDFWSPNLRTIVGNDWLAYLMARGNDSTNTGSNGWGGMWRDTTAPTLSTPSGGLANTLITLPTSASGGTGPSDTTTPGKKYVGRWFQMGPIGGVIIAQTGTTQLQLQVDQWYDMNVTNGTQYGGAITPAGYSIGLMAGIRWVALSTDTTNAPLVQDTALNGEILAATDTGLVRQWAAFSHSTSVGTGGTNIATTFQYTCTFTAATGATVGKCGLFNAVTGGIMGFETRPTDSNGNPTSIGLTAGQGLNLSWLINIS